MVEAAAEVTHSIMLPAVMAVRAETRSVSKRSPAMAAMEATAQTAATAEQGAMEHLAYLAARVDPPRVQM
jgi:hypothetical protein